VSPPRIVVTGAAGQLGRQLVAVFQGAGWQVMEAASHRELDIMSPDSRKRIELWAPDVVVNSAAWTDVDGCAREPERAMHVNGEAAGALAQVAARVGALSVQISTNEVFEGVPGKTYAEDDHPAPHNPYGASKLRGETATAAANARHIIVRTAWIFGPGGRNFVSKILDAARRSQRGEPLRVVRDEIGNPTWAPDLAEGVRQIVTGTLEGRTSVRLLHLAGEPAVSRFGWAERITSGVPGRAIVPISLSEFPRPSPVTPHAVLCMDRARALGLAPLDWRQATGAYVQQLLEGATDAG
jgi:dTDP-4-dehydrorhamnose reductase